MSVFEIMTLGYLSAIVFLIGAKSTPLARSLSLGLLALALVLMFLTAGCATEPLEYGQTCQQKLSKAGMEQDRAFYRCRARGR